MLGRLRTLVVERGEVEEKGGNGGGVQRRREGNRMGGRERGRGKKGRK